MFVEDGFKEGTSLSLEKVSSYFESANLLHFSLTSVILNITEALSPSKLVTRELVLRVLVRSACWILRIWYIVWQGAVKLLVTVLERFMPSITQ